MAHMARGVQRAAASWVHESRSRHSLVCSSNVRPYLRMQGVSGPQVIRVVEQFGCSSLQHMKEPPYGTSGCELLPTLPKCAKPLGGGEPPEVAESQ